MFNIWPIYLFVPLLYSLLLNWHGFLDLRASPSRPTLHLPVTRETKGSPTTTAFFFHFPTLLHGRAPTEAEKPDKHGERNQKTKMGSRLGRRVVNFANLPIKLLMPKTLTNITEISLKTIPSASKIEIRRVLESLYGFDVAKVETLNMEGKKKKRGGLLLARPDYKKAYVTLRRPLSLSQDLFPIRAVEEERKLATKKKPAARAGVVEDGGEGKSHWLHGKENRKVRDERERERERVRGSFGRGGDGGVKFPWSSMRSAAAGGSR